MNKNNEETPADYAPEQATSSFTSLAPLRMRDKDDAKKYGIGKPYRIFIRGTIAADQRSNDDHK